jgi:hypothetical protein
VREHVVHLARDPLALGLARLLLPALPQSLGWERRFKSAAQATLPSATSSTLTASECASHVEESTSSPEPTATATIATSTIQSRTVRVPVDPSSKPPDRRTRCQPSRIPTILGDEE